MRWQLLACAGIDVYIHIELLPWGHLGEKGATKYSPYFPDFESIYYRYMHTNGHNMISLCT
jgi:hypothetical protein